jgi:hypothetical protein
MRLFVRHGSTSRQQRIAPEKRKLVLYICSCGM